MGRFMLNKTKWTNKTYECSNRIASNDSKIENRHWTQQTRLCPKQIYNTYSERMFVLRQQNSTTAHEQSSCMPLLSLSNQHTADTDVAWPNTIHIHIDTIYTNQALRFGTHYQSGCRVSHTTFY